jgi:hypothetical protein
MDVELGISRARESDPPQENRPVEPARHRRWWFPRANPVRVAVYRARQLLVRTAA